MALAPLLGSDPTWFDHLPIALAVLAPGSDGGLCFLAVNRRWRELGAGLGLDPEQVHPEDRQGLRAHSLERLAAGQPLGWQGRVLLRGRHRWVRLEANPRSLADGRLVWDAVLCENEAPNPAEESLARTALAITEAIPVGTYTMVLPAGAELAHFSFMSERFLAICGLEREQALADPLQAFACVHPEDYDAWVQLNAEVFAAKRSFVGECRVVAGDEVRWVRAESVPRPLADGGTVWEGVLIDITDRVRAQQALERSEANLRHILDHLPIPLICQKYTEARELVFLNQSTTLCFGYVAADLPTLEVLGRHFFPDPAQRRSSLERWSQAVERAVGEEGGVESFECQVCGKDGDLRDVLVSSLVVKDLLISSCIDLSERKMAERQRAETRLAEKARENHLRQVLQTKLRSSLTASAVAHEINQPLSTIRLLCEQALQSGAAPSGEPLLRVLLEESERVVVITEKMRMLLRNVETEHHPLRLGPVCRGAITYLQRHLKAHGVQLQLEGLESCAGWVAGDPVQLQIAIGNLLRNAAEAMHNQPPSRRQLLLRLQECSGWLEVLVADQGPGFPAGVRLDREDQAALLRSSKPSGTGIGLYVVHTTVLNHQGRLELGTSARLGGAQVRLRLPLLAEPRPAERRSEKSGLVKSDSAKARLAQAADPLRLAGQVGESSQ